MSISDDRGDWLDDEPDEAGDCCWSCHGEGGYHECGEDTCACLYRDGEEEDQDWFTCPECGGSGYL